MRAFYCLLFVALALFGACRKEEAVNPVPLIKATSFGPLQVRGGNGEDNVLLRFKFYDGDADLGVDPASGDFDIYLTDSRDSSVQGYFIEEIPQGIRDLNIPLDGEATVVLSAALILPRSDSLHQATGDTLRYSYYLRDRAGNKSEVLTTPDLILTP